MSNDFQTVSKRKSSAAANRPMVSVNHGVFHILSKAYTAMGEPDAVEFLIDGDKVAIKPSEPDNPNAYLVSGNGNGCSAYWMDDELAHGEQPQGRFPVEKDGDLWVVDFSDPEGE